MERDSEESSWRYSPEICLNDPLVYWDYQIIYWNELRIGAVVGWKKGPFIKV